MKKSNKNESIPRFNNTMTSRVCPNQPSSTIISLESNPSIPCQNIQLEEEMEKKAIQTIYAQLKQVTLLFRKKQK